MDRTLAKLLEVQGRRIAIGLRSGLRMEDCRLVALPTRLTPKFWLFTEDQNIVVSADDIVEVYELVPGLA